MKKFLFSLTAIITSLLLAIPVYASSSFTASITGSNTFSNEITLYLQVDNITEFNGSCDGLCGIVGNLNYDNTKITLSKISALNSFDLTQGNSIVLYKTTGVGNGTKLLEMKFKNKSLSNGESATISFNNIIASNGDKDIPTSNTSKSIKYVVAQKSSTTKTTTIEKVKSSNNYLSSITLSYGNIEFDKDKLTYEIEVDKEVNSITISGTLEDNTASIIGFDTYTLKDGENIIKLIVKAEDESEKTYTINVVRKSNDNINTPISPINNETPESNNNYLLYGIIAGVIILGIGIYIFLKNKKK